MLYYTKVHYILFHHTILDITFSYIICYHIICYYIVLCYVTLNSISLYYILLYIYYLILYYIISYYIIIIYSEFYDPIRFMFPFSLPVQSHHGHRDASSWAVAPKTPVPGTGRSAGGTSRMFQDFDPESMDYRIGFRENLQEPPFLGENPWFPVKIFP